MATEVLQVLHKEVNVRFFVFWLQVFTKLVPNIFCQKFTPKLIEDGVRKSMAALQVQKLDLVQLHWWDYSIPGMVDTAKVLMDLRGKGLITSIGTTNMSTEALALIVDAGVPVVCNQVDEYNSFCQFS